MINSLNFFKCPNCGEKQIVNDSLDCPWER